MLKKFLFLLSGLILLFILVGLLLPKELNVERQVEVNCEIDNLFELVNTLPNWESWSDWHSMDPTMTNTYSNPVSGEGAFYSWNSEKLGSGTLKITESIPNKSIKTSINFEGNSTGAGYWKFDEAKGTTAATWGFQTTNTGLFAGYKTLLMKGAMGRSLENGLKTLKTTCEKR